MRLPIDPIERRNSRRPALAGSGLDIEHRGIGERIDPIDLDHVAVDAEHPAPTHRDQESDERDFG